MATLTIRLSDDTHTRLRELARHRRMSMNTLMEELSTIAITQHNAETRFRALAARGVVQGGVVQGGVVKEGPRVLNTLDAAFGKTG